VERRRSPRLAEIHALAARHPASPLAGDLETGTAAMRLVRLIV